MLEHQGKQAFTYHRIGPSRDALRVFEHSTVSCAVVFLAGCSDKHPDMQASTESASMRLSAGSAGIF